MPTIMFTRAAASSANTLMISAVLDEENDKAIYQPAARVFQYEHTNPPGEQWFVSDFSLSVQDIAVIEEPELSPDRPRFFALLGAEGDVSYLSWPDRHQEMIEGAGTNNPGSKFYGQVLTLRQIGRRLYVVGIGGQAYVRESRDDWRMLTDAVLFDPDAARQRMEQAPDPDDPSIVEWMLAEINNPVSRNIIFRDIAGLSEDAIYICGEVGPGSKPVLCYWDGQTLEELKIPLEEASLTGIHIESPDSIWLCGREGIILHGSRARGFTPVFTETRLNLFHGFAPYRDKLPMPASARPGGLWQLDPKTGAFGHFEPRLPKLRRLDSSPEFAFNGPFFVQAFGDIIWAVANKDIFRFDGQEWERIKHPDLP
ncbi:MAG: hypothetical protein Q4G24_15875 [Paracoccus sp. (in: a-proteobacteria)]|uniref:hypothetical protein n=1 Tax=Paracoccus sp. TaxID=267 RepID=UPI0026DF690B|nr:hypothetical protein [Paracoccus sp. (in: a-proteobacteria)]MDO5622924.1 hypothetical protein [Paracoccus sp. (in: a-proteobacteria)]